MKLQCPICGNYFRKMRLYGPYARSNAECQNCGSLERYRLLYFWLKFELNVNLTGLRKYELKFNNLTSAKGAFQNELFSDERYWKNGQKAYEKTYRNGIKNGKWIEWFENGQKAYEKTYKEGKEDGLRISWNENGDKVYEEKIIDGIVSELVFINVKNFLRCD